MLQKSLTTTHMHCIIPGGSLTRAHKLRLSSGKFFIPVKVLGDKFKGKYMAGLARLFGNGPLVFSSSCSYLKNSFAFKEWKNRLYEKGWCPFIKGTFNGFGNAIGYLGRYTHRMAIPNSRVLSVSGQQVTFSARGLKPSGPKRQATLGNTEFIRRFLMHVLPPGSQGIRYYGFLNNRMGSQNLKPIFKLQSGQRFRRRYAGMAMAELLMGLWGCDTRACHGCGCISMKQLGRVHAASG